MITSCLVNTHLVTVVRLPDHDHRQSYTWEIADLCHAMPVNSDDAAYNVPNVALQCFAAKILLACVVQLNHSGLLIHKMHAEEWLQTLTAHRAALKIPLRCRPCSCRVRMRASICVQGSVT
jgi:hypothetical protein